jgi:hypothetical protein
MDMYAILDDAGAFVRAETTEQRANRARIDGFRVVPLAVQVSHDGFSGHCAEGELKVTPGKREWIPANVQTSKPKKLDKTDLKD